MIRTQYPVPLRRSPQRKRSRYRHLVDRGKVTQLKNFDESVLHIFSRDVLRRIKEHDSSWESMVPCEVAEVIQRRRFFGYDDSQELGGTSKP